MGLGEEQSGFLKFGGCDLGYTLGQRTVDHLDKFTFGNFAQCGN